MPASSPPVSSSGAPAPGRRWPATSPHPSAGSPAWAPPREHTSTLTLVNPDKGPAVADVTLWDGSGLVDVPALRGVRVPGSRSVSFDLAEVAPNRDALAAQVLVSRGRLAASVVDVLDPVGTDPAVREWLPAQDAPAETSYVVGVQAAAADRTLTLANPGDSEVRVALRLVSGESEFAPSGVEEVTLAPATVTEVDLAGVLRGPTAEGVQALRLDATGPVTAALRTRTASDLAFSVAGPVVEGDTAVALPAGSKRVVVAGAEALRRPGAAGVGRRRRAGGARAPRRGRARHRGPASGCPTRRCWPSSRVERTGAVVSVEVDDRGLSVLPLSALVTTGQVPDVRPAQR